MSRLIQGLIALVIVLGGLQFFVPRWAGSLVSRQLSRLDHGPRPAVAVEAMPFWELFTGRFQDVTVNAHNADVHSLAVQHIHLNWSNGALNLNALEKGRLKVKSAGRLSMTVVLTSASLSQFLAKQGTISHPQVVIKPTGLALHGRIRLAGATVPLDTQGTLIESPSHQALIFHPTSIDGLNLPVLTDVQLINLSSLKLPMPLTIASVRLQDNQLALSVEN